MPAATPPTEDTRMPEECAEGSQTPGDLASQDGVVACRPPGQSIEAPPLGQVPRGSGVVLEVAPLRARAPHSVPLATTTPAAEIHTVPRLETPRVSHFPDPSSCRGRRPQAWVVGQGWGLWSLRSLSNLCLLLLMNNLVVRITVKSY